MTGGHTIGGPLGGGPPIACRDRLGPSFISLRPMGCHRLLGISRVDGDSWPAGSRCAKRAPTGHEFVRRCRSRRCAGCGGGRSGSRHRASSAGAR
jgi:hypothetical protein